MTTLSDLLWFVVLGALVYHWWHARHIKTVALHHAARRCRELDLQLLDQSVALRKLRPRRIPGGGLQWQREYEFEFSSTGTDRYRGSLVMLGPRLCRMELDAHVTG